MNHSIANSRTTYRVAGGLPKRLAPLLASDAAKHAPLMLKVIAFLCAGAFVSRSSLLMQLVSDNAVQYLSFITVGSLLISAAFAMVDGIGRIDMWGFLLILATGVSLWHCERLDFALWRWIGWVILLLVLGPVRSTWRACQFRRYLIEFLYAMFVAVVVLSAMWRLAELPTLGRGIFCGVMAHSMILGPIAGLVGIRALVRLVDRGSVPACVLYFVSLIVCVLASSRAALAALAAGSFVVIALRWKKQPLIASLAVTLMVAFIVAPDSTLDLLGRVLPQELTAGVQNKSWDNTRELHWEARWEEFLSSPITGVGFASAWADTVGVDDESGAVETGSSYLAVLSMTGFVGAAACLLFVAALGRRILMCWRRLSQRQVLEFCSLGAFWMVHLGAEGYIYAVSSLLGFTFWLWLGCVSDDLSLASRIPATRNVVSSPRAMNVSPGTWLRPAHL